MEKKHLEIKNKADCTGCRACEQLCPVKCITMVEDQEGFIYPHIDEEKCINCGLCKKRCPQLNSKTGSKENKVYAVKSKDVKNSKKSTSAGMAYILTKKIIEKNGIVFGCAYNDNLVPIQKKVDTEKDLEKLRGSKYVFSNTLNTYKEVKKELEDNKDVIYIGTPCQIGGLYAFLGKEYEKLLTVDLVCHGAPSQKLFSKYLKYLENKFGQRVINYEFRNKDKAIWGEYCAKVTLENDEKYIEANFDPFYSNFLKGTIYRECCYKCKYANTDRVGDITLADFWGIEQINSNFYSKEGISLVFINTPKGAKIFDEVKKNIDYEEHSIEEAVRKNGNLSHPTPRSEKRDFTYKDIDNKDIESYIKSNLKVDGKLKKKIKKLIPRKIKNIIKKVI